MHEVAHLVYNCKRATNGLPPSRRREWLLDGEDRKRETFACSCQAYARILSRASEPVAQASVVQEFAASFRPGDPRVDVVEVADILREAVSRRDGWKRILA